jgi:hypothetical protein
MDLTERDRVWNRAALEDGGDEPRAGDRALADLFEEGLNDESFGVGDPDDAEDAANERYWAVIPDDDAISARFEAVFASSPGDFEPARSYPEVT